MGASLIGDNIQVPLTVGSWQTSLSSSLQSVHGQSAWWFQAWNPQQGQAQLTVQPLSRKVFDSVLGLLQSWSESNRILRFYWPERTINWSVTISSATATLKPDVPVPSISLRLQLLSSWLSSETTATLPSGDNLSMIAGRMVHKTVNQLTASAATQTTSGGAIQNTAADAWSVTYHGETCTITVKTGPHKGTVLRNVPSAQAAQYLAQGYSPVAFQALQELSQENSQTSSGRSQNIWQETLGDIISQWL